MPPGEKREYDALLGRYDRVLDRVFTGVGFPDRATREEAKSARARDPEARRIEARLAALNQQYLPVVGEECDR